jgi:hypothetical protein
MFNSSFERITSLGFIIPEAECRTGTKAYMYLSGDHRQISDRQSREMNQPVAGFVVKELQTRNVWSKPHA